MPSFNTFSSNDIAKIISHLDPNKGHGHDRPNIWMNGKKLTLYPYIRKQANRV